jgi:hypothetical protein
MFCEGVRVVCRHFSFGPEPRTIDVAVTVFRQQGRISMMKPEVGEKTAQ